MPCYKKLLLTGATGLIGQELILPLKKAGFDIYAISTKENDNNTVNWCRGNLFDENFIKDTMEKVRPEYLLNMAWATTGDYLSSEVNYSFLNAGINLLKYFKQNGGKRAVFAGTCFEYKFKDEPLKEDAELDPNKTVYTFCKNKLHEIAEYYCSRNSISFGWGRIFYVYGKNENNTRLTGMLVNKLLNNEEVIIKSGSLVKDYIYTKDIAGAFTKFLDSNIEGSVNICSGNPISIKDFVLTIAKQMGKENLLVFKDEHSKQPPIIVGDNSKLVNDLKYKLKYSLEDALNEILSTV